MALIQRQTGTASQKLLVFVNDATVSTGAGLANVVASSVTFAWARDDMSAVSSGTCTTGTLGTFGVSSFVQALSTNALGWYQFCPPDGVFLSGSSAFIHLSLAPNMAPLPLLIELTKTDNQHFMSSQTVSTTLNSLGVVMTDKAGYGVSSVNTGVNVSSVNGSGIVTSSAGVLNVSTQTIDKAGYGVSSVNTGVNVTSVVGSAAVTSAAGIMAHTWDLGRTANLTSTVALTGLSINLATTVANLTGTVTTSVVSDKAGYGVSSVNTGVNVSSIVGSPAVTTAAGILAYTFDLGRTANPNSTVTFSSLSISTQPVTVGAVNVSSVNGAPLVTTSPGVISVYSIGGSVQTSSLSVGVNASTVSGQVSTVTNLDKTGYSTVDFVSAMPESFRAVSTVGTPTQLLYEILGNLTNFVNTSSHRYVASATSYVVGPTYAYDSSTAPTSISRDG